MKAEENDWVSFYQNGKLVISAVRYVIKENIGSEVNYYTDLGLVYSCSILEVRKPNKDI